MSWPRLSSKRALILVDSREQAIPSGEINVPIHRGQINQSAIYAERGEIVAGRKPGRTSADQLRVFESTGLAIQDIASDQFRILPRTMLSGRRRLPRGWAWRSVLWGG